MLRLFKTKDWQVWLPNGWKADTVIPGVVMFYDLSGIGMLKIRTPGKAYNPAGVGEDFRGKLTGKYYAGKVYKGTFMRAWHLSCKGQQLNINYSCGDKNAELEPAIVDEIVGNIQATDTESSY